MDQCWTPFGHFRLIFQYNYTFYSRYNTVWIAKTKICLDPNNSVIKRLWCNCIQFLTKMLPFVQENIHNVRSKMKQNIDKN